MPPKTYNCDIPLSTCLGSSSFTKAKAVELAVRCKAVATKEEAESMTQTKLCYLIAKARGEDVPDELLNKPSRARLPAGQTETKDVICQKITDAIFKASTKPYLIEVAIKCGALTEKDRNTKLLKADISKLINARIEAMEREGAASGGAASGAPPTVGAVAEEEDEEEEGKEAAPRDCQNITVSQCRTRSREEVESMAVNCGAIERGSEKSYRNKQLICDAINNKAEIDKRRGQPAPPVVVRPPPAPVAVRPPQVVPQVVPQAVQQGDDDSSDDDIVKPSSRILLPTPLPLPDPNLGGHKRLKILNQLINEDWKKEDFENLTQKKLERIAKYLRIDNYKNVSTKKVIATILLIMQNHDMPTKPICYEGLSKENLRVVSDKRLREYAQKLDINDIIDENLPDYICAKTLGKTCSEDDNNCDNDEFCDISNKICVPKNAGNNQVGNNEFSKFEHNGKVYIGRNESIERLKEKLAPQRVVPPVVEQQGAVEQEEELVAAAERICYDNKTAREMKHLKWEQLRRYAQELGLQDVDDIEQKRKLIDYICSNPCNDNYDCLENQVCDVKNKKCIKKDTAQYRVDNNGYVQTEINGKLVVGRKEDVDRLLELMNEQTVEEAVETVADEIQGEKIPVEEVLAALGESPAAAAGEEETPVSGVGERKAGDDEPIGENKLTQRDIEEILAEINTDAEPVAINRLSPIEKQILACLGVNVGV